MTSRDTKRVCSACLSGERKLFQLNSIPDGVNLLTKLLHLNTDVAMEGFFKDYVVCWECRAIITKIIQFRAQTCIALKQLRDIVDSDEKLITLSKLTTQNNPTIIIETDFINCGADIKQEINDEYLNNNSEDEQKVSIDFEGIQKITNDFEDRQNITNSFEDERNITNSFEDEQKITRTLKDEQKGTKILKDEERINNILEEEQRDTKSMKNEQMINNCIDKHKIKNPDTPNSFEDDSKNENNKLIENSKTALPKRKKTNKIHPKLVTKKERKKCVKTNQIRKYPCTECDMTFVNKGVKWKHVQRCHREGHRCTICEKAFSFKHNLERHQLTHSTNRPSVPCPVCQKQVRTELLARHATTHGPRARHTCAPCGRDFVSRATYDAHMKGASAHVTSIHRYDCSLCDKKYASRGELRDHVAFRHEKRPRHKCPVCDKLLATRRCVTRHVRRAHDGVKEKARDKMCDYCGIVFTDKRTLTEHIWRHTGARPLACLHCGRSFRQQAALKKHTMRLHPDIG